MQRTGSDFDFEFAIDGTPPCADYLADALINSQGFLASSLTIPALKRASRLDGRRIRVARSPSKYFSYGAPRALKIPLLGSFFNTLLESCRVSAQKPFAPCSCMRTGSGNGSGG